MNPLYKESLSQLIEAGKRVVDNPTHLADFGKYWCYINSLASGNMKHFNLGLYLERYWLFCVFLMKHDDLHRFPSSYPRSFNNWFSEMFLSTYSERSLTSWFKNFSKSSCQTNFHISRKPRNVIHGDPVSKHRLPYWFSHDLVESRRNILLNFILGILVVDPIIFGKKFSIRTLVSTRKYYLRKSAILFLSGRR